MPLIALAYGRSGDKGDAANIGVLARKPEFLPLLRDQLTPEAVAAYFAHFAPSKVERFEIPGLGGFNFLLHNALGGGGVASLRYDPQGKMMAQILMDFAVQVPAAWVSGDASRPMVAIPANARPGMAGPGSEKKDKVAPGTAGTPRA